jgi:hypothetical protein
MNYRLKGHSVNRTSNVLTILNLNKTNLKGLLKTYPFKIRSLAHSHYTSLKAPNMKVEVKKLQIGNNEPKVA